jgi:vancomycin resistance protein YoaR
LEQETVKSRRLTQTWWFWVLIAVAVVVVLFAAAILADWLVYYDEIHAGVTVAGVYLRGMTEEQAVAALNELVDRAGGPITLKSGDKSWSITPADVGRVMNVEGAVLEAMAVSRDGNFFEDVYTRFRLYRHGRDLPLNGSIDRAKLDAALLRIATELHVTPQNARLAMQNGQIQVIEGLKGQDVDTPALGAQVESLFVRLHTATLEVPLIVKEPDVQVEDNLVAREQAETMMSGPITLASHDKKWTLSPEQIASWVDFRTEYENGLPKMIPYLAQGRMWHFLDGLAPEVNIDPVNARFVAEGGSPRVVPAVVGETLDATATAKALNAAALQSTGRTAEVAVILGEPDFTTAEAQATTFSDQLSTFTTEWVGSAGRQVNVRITTAYATDVFLAPGQEYNFDKQIGPRTAARGYELAPGITGPNTLEDVLGGGICQVSTTMFNAVFFAGLKVTERHNHSIYINHYPKGRDATVSAGGKNLRFVNDTAHHIWIRGTSDGVTTTISIYGTSDGRKVTYSVGDFYNVRAPTTVTIKAPTLPVGQTKVIDSGQTGRKLRTFRTVTMPDGTVIHDNTWISTWPMYPKQVAVGTKTAP